MLKFIPENKGEKGEFKSMCDSDHKCNRILYLRERMYSFVEIQGTKKPYTIIYGSRIYSVIRNLQ